MPAHQGCSAPALERGLQVLEALARSKRGLTLSELARRLGLAKSSTHCLVVTLERCGYLCRQDATRRYMFGLKLFSLERMALAKVAVRDEAAHFLSTLMEETRLTVHLAVLEQEDVVLVDKVEPPGLLKFATWVGKRMEAHCTAIGKALLAYLPEEVFDRLVKQHGLLRHNENTICSARRLKRELAEVRRSGYSLDNEEDELGVRCIGAPIFDHTGTVTAAVSVAGTVTQISSENLPLFVTKVKNTAAAISQQLGHFWKPDGS